jgi:hypothetical protein
VGIAVEAEDRPRENDVEVNMRDTAPPRRQSQIDVKGVMDEAISTVIRVVVCLDQAISGLHIVGP